MADEQPDQLPRIYASAFLCHELIFEEEKNLLTAIRISNTYAAFPIEILYGGKSVAKVFEPLDTHIVLTVWSEEDASFTVTLKGIQPDGSPAPGGITDEPIVLGGDKKAHTLKVNVRIQTSLIGTFWFELYIINDLVMRLPLHIVHPDPTYEKGQVRIELSPPRTEQE